MSGRAAVRMFGAYVASVIIAYLLASVFQSAFVLVRLERVGAEISAAMWLRTVVHDLYGFIVEPVFFSYPLSILVGLLVAFAVATLVVRWARLPALIAYPLAGATAVATILLIVQSRFSGATLFAGARGVTGFGLQLLAGAVGGVVFALLWKRREYDAV